MKHTNTKLWKAAAMGLALIISTSAGNAEDSNAMILTNEDGTVTYQEVRRVFDILDAQDVKGFGALLSEDISMRFGNGSAMVGKEAVAEAQSGFFSEIAAMEHTISPDNIWSKPGSFAIAGTATYTRHDGSTVELAVADTFTVVDGKITVLNVYWDAAPLFAPN